MFCRKPAGVLAGVQPRPAGRSFESSAPERPELLPSGHVVTMPAATRNASQMQRYDVTQLRNYCTEIFLRAGIPAEDAELTSAALVLTDMRGISSHGVLRAAHYITCIQAGGLRPDGRLEITAAGGGFLRLSAAGGLGIPAAMRATDLLIDHARTQAIAIATLNHSDHYGAAGLYAQRCSDAGLLGFSMSNTCPMIAVTGAAAKGIGNNPFAYAAPGRRHRGILFDVCMSVVASGKIQIAAAENRKIPLGWIVDREGNPTDDPQHIYQGGSFLPFAGHKGYGFAVMVELLSGILANAGLLAEVRSWNKTPGRESNTGHCFLAINPAFFGGEEHFRQRTDQMIDSLTSVPKAPGCAQILYPGEIEFGHEADALEHGVPLPEPSLDELKKAGKLVGLPFALPAVTA